MKHNQTVAQKWSVKRNWKKYQLSQMKAVLNKMSIDKVLLPIEQDAVSILLYQVRSLLLYWDKRNFESKEEYLT